MNTTVRAQQWTQTIFRFRYLVFTLCLFLLTPVRTACAQGTANATGPVSPASGPLLTPATTTPHPQQFPPEEDTLPQRKQRKSVKIAGVSLSIAGTISAITGGVLVLMAAGNDNQVKDYSDQWMIATDPIERKQLKQDIRDTEDKRDLQNTFGLGALSVGVGALITGLLLLSRQSEAPSGPVSPRYTQSPLRFRPLVGAAEVGLQVMF